MHYQTEGPNFYVQICEVENLHANLRGVLEIERLVNFGPWGGRRARAVRQFIDERREAVRNLTSDGHSQREACRNPWGE
jgi:hypothetical protein